jgi:hypothetical protein
MAFEDLENQECLCAWIALLGDGPKQQLALFIDAAKVLLEAAKAAYVLVYASPDEVFRKQLLEATLEIYQSATEPLEAPLEYLVSQTAPLADCPPVASIAAVMKSLRDYLLGEVDEFEYQLEQYTLALDEMQANTDFFDNLIGILEDVLDAIEKC